MINRVFIPSLIAAKGHKLLRGIVALPIFAILAVLEPARAETVVAIELLLALDSSASMNAEEFDLQVQGIAQAFRDPEILKAIKNLEPLGVALAVTQWGGPGESRLVVPFTHVRSARDAKAFGFRVGLGSRSFAAASTSIASAIDDGVALLDTNGFDGQRKIIDISGDGQDNSGLDLAAARDRALGSNVGLNGLAIQSEDAGLAEYYRQNVIVGAESFVITATDFSDYGRAIKEKLLRELRPLGS